MPFSKTATDNFSEALSNIRGRTIFITKEDSVNVKKWQEQGFNIFLKTPDNTVVFVSEEEGKQIKENQKNCMGCLSQCVFSNWADKLPGNTTGRSTDPRSFCIQKTLQDVIHGGSIEQNLLFAGKNAYRFATDSLYKNNYIPTIKELIEHLVKGC